MSEQPESVRKRIEKIQRTAQEKYSKMVQMVQDKKKILEKLKQALSEMDTLQGDKADYQTLEKQWKIIVMARDSLGNISKKIEQTRGVEDFLKDAFSAARINVDDAHINIQDMTNEIAKSMKIGSLDEEISAIETDCDKYFAREQEAMVYAREMSSGIKNLQATFENNSEKIRGKIQEISATMSKTQELSEEATKGKRAQIILAGGEAEAAVESVFKTPDELEKMYQSEKQQIQKHLNDLGIALDDPQFQIWQKEAESILDNQKSKLTRQLVEFSPQASALQLEYNLYRELGTATLNISQKMESYIENEVKNMAEDIVRNLRTDFEQNPEYNGHLQRTEDFRKNVERLMHNKLDELFKKYHGKVDVDTWNRIQSDVVTYVESQIKPKYDESIQIVSDAVNLAQSTDRQVQNIKVEAMSKMDKEYKHLIEDLKQLSDKLSSMQDTPPEKRVDAGELKIYEEVATIKGQLQKLEKNSTWLNFLHINAHNVIEDALKKGLKPGEDFSEALEGLMKKYGVTITHDPQNSAVLIEGAFIQQYKNKRESLQQEAYGHIAAIERMGKQMDEKRKIENKSLNERMAVLGVQLENEQRKQDVLKQDIKLKRESLDAKQQAALQDPQGGQVLRAKTSQVRTPESIVKNVVKNAERPQKIKLDPHPFELQKDKDVFENFRELNKQMGSDLKNYRDLHSHEQQKTGSFTKYGHFRWETDHKTKDEIAGRIQQKLDTVAKALDNPVPPSQSELFELITDVEQAIKENKAATTGLGRGKLDDILGNLKDGLVKIQNSAQLQKGGSDIDIRM